MMPKLRLRRAGPHDWGRLYAWRNDPITRAHFKVATPVTLGEHVDWLGRTLADPTIRLYIAEAAPPGALREVGTCRLDLIRDRAVVECSVTVAPPARGRGYGTAIVRAMRGALDELRRDRQWRRPLHAVVHQDNYPSLATFAANGFQIVRIDSLGWVLLEEPCH